MAVVLSNLISMGRQPCHISYNQITLMGLPPLVILHPDLVASVLTTKLTSGLFMEFR